MCFPIKCEFIFCKLYDFYYQKYLTVDFPKKDCQGVCFSINCVFILCLMIDQSWLVPKIWRRFSDMRRAPHLFAQILQTSEAHKSLWGLMLLLSKLFLLSPAPNPSNARGRWPKCCSWSHESPWGVIAASHQTLFIVSGSQSIQC